MYDDVVEKILEVIDDKYVLTESYPKFSGGGYRAHKIESKNFHPIKKSEIPLRIAFIDGGNAQIIGSANFSLNMVRVAYSIYENNRKIAAKKLETMAFAKSFNDKNEIFYKVSFFGGNNIGGEELSFSSFDHTLMTGINRVDISSVANAVRRFAELKVAKLVADEKMADFVVLDGNLQSTITNENNYLNELYDSCSKNNVVLGALSKTSSLFTDNGNLLGFVLDKISNMPSWFYYPVVDIKNSNHKAEMFFVKMHPSSRHIFRFEIFNAQAARAENAISALAANSIDPVFIGYPYGLIEADRIARISNQERETLKTMFLVKIKNKDVEKYLSSSNAHEILDRMRF